MANPKYGRRPPRVISTTREVPGWLVTSTLVLSLLGLAVSSYLTIEHLQGNQTLACPPGEQFNCTKVTSSEYSKLFGIPVAYLGLGYFVAMVALCWPSVWRRRNPWLDRARMAALAAGVVMVCYLVWAELYRIGSICLWCTAVHLITVVLFFLALLGAALMPPSPTRR